MNVFFGGVVGGRERRRSAEEGVRNERERKKERSFGGG